MSERCEVCDRPRATDEQWRDVPPGDLAALPADLAVERFRRERAEALEAAADGMRQDTPVGSSLVDGMLPWEWLRARAADERGGR